MDIKLNTILLLYIMSMAAFYMVYSFFIIDSLFIVCHTCILISVIFYMLYVIIQKQKELKQLSEEFEDKLKQKTEDVVIACEKQKLLSLKEMIKNISHQWRQPLNTISLISSSMQYEDFENDFNKEKVLKSCSLVSENTQYLSHILDMFDGYLCTKTEKTIFQFDSIIIALLQMKIGDIKLIYEIKDETSLYSHKKDLLQVLINIINNSKDIFEQRDIKEKYIFIEFSTVNNEFIIDIKDNAGGIDKKILNRVFEPYFTTKHQFQGTGLGLYSVYLTVTKKLGGSIRVENSEYVYEGEEYKGARFVIRIPKT